MKSIQIILLMCIHLGVEFPSTMTMDANQRGALDANIAALLKKGLIDTRSATSPARSQAGYSITQLGREAVHQLWSIFDYDIRALK